MHLGLIGHPRTLSIITQIISTYYPHYQVTPIYFIKTDVTEVVDYLKNHESEFDCLIFSGPVPYDLINSAMFSKQPWDYIRKDLSQLLSVLLEATLNQHYDIRKIAIDSYPEERILKVYDELHLQSDLVIEVSHDPIFSEQFLENLKQFHYNHYVSQRVNMCITGISSVYEYLLSHNVPTLMLDPTVDSVLDTLERLNTKMLALSEKKTTHLSQLIVLSIERDLPNEHGLMSENEYQLALETMKIAENIYLFAQRIQAAVVEGDGGRFLLFTTRTLFEIETNQLTELALLSNHSDHRYSTLSIGIGYGVTAREAKYNAQLGLLRAKKNGGNQGFKVENGHYHGPIGAKLSPLHQIPRPIDGHFQKIADTSGLSLNTIMKIQSIMDQHKTDVFLPIDLAHYCGISLRSMNRQIEKLILHRYAYIIGRSMQNSSGRPSRIVKLQFNTPTPV